MSKSIYICSRERISPSVDKRLHLICKKLAPDNIIPNAPKVMVNEYVAYGVMNPNNSTLVEMRNSLLIGHFFFKNKKWFEPLTEFPDGSYALYRDNESYCEIVSDPAASRTIWYYFDEDTFIASTSQRMIVMFIGSFEFDERVIPWMLSTGTLGPDFSWDRRIKQIPPDSSVILSKSEWSISVKSNPLEFKPVERSDEDHEKLLREAHKTTLGNLNIDYSKWILPLSGGYDSRAILCFLHATNTNIQGLRTVTWGLGSSLTIKGNDAYVAKELANALNISHKYYQTDLSDEPIETIINRFVMVGEGRVDHLSAYMDGFKIWKTLFEDGIQGIIRGDVGFTGHEAFSSLKMRKNINCLLCSNFANLKYYSKYGFPSQNLPQRLQRQKGETLELWRDRLYHQYRLPIIMSALSDLKFSYTEQINPLLSRIILQQVRQLPDHLRTKKILLKKIVISLSPRVNFATDEAEASPIDVLTKKEMVILLKRELSSNYAKKILPSEFLKFILKGTNTKEHASLVKSTLFSFKSSLTKNTSGFIKRTIRRVLRPNVDPNILAFRVLLIIKMNRILNEDKDLCKD